jgi:DNA-binding response OmpR family regulator
VNPETGTASVLLIADDPAVSEPYADALRAGRYDVAQATSFVDAPEGAIPDLVILVGQAGLAYPRSGASVLRVAAGTSPEALITEVHRRIGLRATLQAIIARAA